METHSAQRKAPRDVGTVQTNIRKNATGDHGRYRRDLPRSRPGGGALGGLLSHDASRRHRRGGVGSEAEAQGRRTSLNNQPSTKRRKKMTNPNRANRGASR